MKTPCATRCSSHPSRSRLLCVVSQKGGFLCAKTTEKGG